MCACALLLALAMSADDPIDNPIATFYSGPEGYPAWTDGVRWSRVINMKTYAKGKTEFQKFENARDELREGGGVLYYPAGLYDFTTMPPGRGLMLCHDVVIRGEAPKTRTPAADGALTLGTKFIFPFRVRGGGMVPADWNFIGLQIEKGKTLGNSTDNVGIAWVHLVGAGVFFGPDMEWASSWGTSDSPFTPMIKKAWRIRRPDGTHPFDALIGGKKYLGAGKGRLVFGCIVEDAPPLDDFLDPGYGTEGFSTQAHGARIAVYGSRIFVANNVLPRSRKSFVHLQRTSQGPKPVLYDYGKTCGIDINKELLSGLGPAGASAGYFEEGIVVRDNYVFNHGHTGFNIAGNWVTIRGNNNDRTFLRQGDKTGVRPWVLTLDGFEVAGASSDNRSRAFDLAGRNVWIDSNRFTNTGSKPGKDGEGIACRVETGMPIYSWAITHNVHKRGTGAAGYLGGSNLDCHGLLIAWNETPGWVGLATKKAGRTMTDCAFVANKCLRVSPEKKTPSSGTPTPPKKVSISVHETDAVKVTWTADGPADGFRVERKNGRRQVARDCLPAAAHRRRRG